MRRVRAAPRRRKARDEIRLDLLQAAAEVIGEHGFAGCSISRVTERAGIAHGAFYNHFESQQAMFEQLLPAHGRLMTMAIMKAIRGAQDVVEIERRGFAANLEYLETHPYMFRLHNESMLFANEAFVMAQEDLADGYVRSLIRNLPEDRKSLYTHEELRMFSVMLIGARTHLVMNHCENGKYKRLSDAEKDAYLKFAEIFLRQICGQNP